ncbi:hypothetical protein N181_05040 [Sinorhizobium fredii USDA 205]|nr:hypothetical protein N181_05040 [Sinorhizobium fredii USDA 205]UTY48754.1 hypothetical protein EPK84_19255 [Sinorhizobium fredii]
MGFRLAVTGRLQWRTFATSAMFKTVACTLLAFETLGKMPAHVYMRLTAVLRLMLSLLFETPSFDAGNGDRFGRTSEYEARIPMDGLNEEQDLGRKRV